MKKVLLSLILLFCFSAFAQQDAWIYFNSKWNAQYYYENPLEMLSQRALDRRINQNIPLDEKDIPINQANIDQVDAVTDINVMAKSKWMNAVHVRGTIAAIKSLSSLSFVDKVVFADKSLNASTSGKMVQQKHLQKFNKTLETQVDYNYGDSANQIQMLKGHLLHQQNFSGSGKVIAVLDAGFEGVDITLPFKKLRDNNQILGGYNFVARNENIYTSSLHGTSVLSTMGGFVDNELVGTATDASYYLFVTEDVAAENPLEESLWVEAAEKADSLGVDIINTSLGYFIYDNPNYSYTYSDMNGKTSFISRGADIAFSRGIFVVVSAGNSGSTTNPHIGAPADAINVLTVGAVDANGQQAGFSSIGNTSDGRVKPDVVAQGQSAVLSDSAGNIVTMSGTSFSSPIAAGMVASLWQALPHLTNADLLQKIKQSSSLYSNPTIYVGYGIPDFSLAAANALSLNENSKNQVTFYPNPVTDRLHLIFPSDFTNAVFYFFSPQGQMVLQKEWTSETNYIDLEELNSGLYLYNIESGTYSQTGKILKM